MSLTLRPESLNHSEIIRNMQKANSFKTNINKLDNRILLRLFSYLNSIDIINVKYSNKYLNNFIITEKLDETLDLRNIKILGI